MPGQFQDVVSAIRCHAAGPDRVALTWLADLAEAGPGLTFVQLDREASMVAAALRARCQPGDRVLLLQQPGLDFVTGFVGCLYAGMVAVPVYPEVSSVSGLRTIGGIATDCGASLIWTSDGATAAHAQEALGIAAAWETGAAAFVPEQPPDLGLPAFLQYTSGSTGRPKGVVVTHGNLAANVTAIAATFRHDQSTVLLSWLPGYHDMGLIGNILHPLHLGCRAFLAPPLAFIRRPAAWVEAVAKYRVSTSGAPNFAYALVAEEIERRGLPGPGVDLSCWRVAYCGAEPVRAQALRRFADCLSPLGFSAESFVPCYGLAEATLLVTCAPIGRRVVTHEAPGSASVVSCGPAQGCNLAVVDPARRRCPAGQEGEILVSGPGVAAGYWNRPEATREVFASKVAGDDRNWLRTGDLGFLAAGELHVTGRRKDLLIVRGRNHHPADIEQLAVEQADALRPGCLAVFSVPGAAGAEEVVLVGELRSGRSLSAAERRRLAAAVTAEFGIAVAEIVIVPKGQVPRTTSGKIRRGETRDRFLAGRYGACREPRHSSTEAGHPGVPEDRAEAVRQAVREVIGRDVPREEPLAAYGLDSLGAVRLAQAVFRYTGADVDVARLIEGASLATVLRLVAEQPEPAEPVPAPGPAAQAAPDLGARACGRLTQAQESLAFLHFLDPTDDAYVISCAWELGSAADPRALDAALRLAVRNDPELAMRIVTTPGGLRRERVPGDRLEPELALEPARIPADQLPDRLADAVAEPFDLSAGPLFRLRVWLAGSRRVYQFVAHHVVTDQWSLCLLLRDLGAAYGALAAGHMARLAPPPRYDDFVADQREYLDSAAAAERDELLRRRLPDRAEPLGLLTEGPRGRRRDARAGRVTATLPEQIVGGFPGADPVASLTALWALCVHRYGTPSPVVVGVPVAGRPRGRHAEVRGLCTNTVPLAFGIDPDQPLRSLAGNARAQLNEGIAAGLYPLARAAAVVRPGRVPGRFPLVETLVTVEQNPLPELDGLIDATSGLGAVIDLSGLRLSTIPARPRNSRYDLDLVITPRPGGWRVTLDYAAALFSEQTARAILATYLAMAEAATRPGNLRVRDVFVLSAADQDLLERSHAKPAEPPCVPPTELIRRVSAAAPGAPAIADPTGVVTFGQLTARIGALGQVLRAALPTSDAAAAPGAIPPQLALLLEPPAQFATAMFAAWSVGLGIMPLPADFPDARLRHMLADSEAGLVLASRSAVGRGRRLVAELARPVGVLVYEDAVADRGPTGPAAPPPSAAAYTVYTSGSTGAPKGVLIRQGQLGPLIAWSGRAWRLGPWVRMAQTLSLGFDFGLQEIFTSVPYGGCLMVPGSADRRDALSYARFLRRERITVLFTTPSYANELVAAGEPMPDLRLVLLGGEVLGRGTVAGLRALTKHGCRLFNGYGPTEATVNCLMYEVPAGLADDWLPAVIPVGRASGASRVSAVDEHGCQVPVGAPGQLVIAGPGVAAGYLRPGPSADRFAPDPGGTGPEDRIYRSGDVAYVNRDGDLVVTGRADRQVKVRGFRVEPGEIEHALRSVPGVRDALIRVAGSPGRLVAFVLADMAEVAELRQALAGQLPPAMIPEQFVRLESVPFTANGKTDEDALRQLAERAWVPMLSEDASLTEVERLVCGVWSELLGATAVPGHANVFDVGAHSLMVTGAHSRLEAALGITFPMHILFEHPSPHGLAHYLAARRPQRAAAAASAHTATTVKEQK
jgi:amino acid adenylation domain-containing protein